MKIPSILSKLFQSIYSRSPSFVRSIFSFGGKKLGFYPSSFKSTQSKGEFTVKVSEDVTFMMISYGSSIENEIIKNGLFKTWESDVGWIWTSLCKNANVILDVGANRGVYSLIARSLNPHAKIIAFEPSIHHFNKLKANVKLNGFDIRCEQLAVSNKNGKQKFYDLPNPNRNTASLSAEKMKNFKGYSGSMLEYEVKTETLSNYIQHNSIPKVDLIKMDIEMYEPEAIEGLKNYLVLHKPIIILEVLSQEIAARLNCLIPWKDFRLFHLRKDASAKQMYEFKLTPDLVSRGEWNFILFHNDLENKIRQETALYN